jgi:hypothetical protein
MDFDKGSSPSRLLGQATTPAKLSLPRLAQGVSRPRLFALLDEARRGAGTWIAAPGGAGKTTLAATYLIERGLPYLWYQLDSDDADPATFFYYLGIAARQLNPDLHLPLLTPEYLPDIPGFARRYFRDLFARLPRDLVLVLDNYQDLGEVPLFAKVLSSALDAIPHDAHCLILSRSGLSSDLVHDGLMLLGWEGLRLSLEETRDIIANDQPCDEEMVKALHARADGWPAAITLLLEQLRRGNLSDGWESSDGPLETVFDFFANEFFDNLPEIVQDFLLKTALLSHMTPSLAAAVTGNQHAASVLDDLHRRHFFVHRRDLGEISYQYHALFREFLLAKLIKLYSNETYLTAVRHAGAALIERGREEEAVGMYLQAQDWEMAVPLLLNMASSLLAQGRVQIIASWLQRMPEALVESIPWLMFWKGLSRQFIDPSSARELLEKTYLGFVSESDVLGQMLVASVLIDGIYMLRLGIIPCSRWVDILQNHFEVQEYFPSSGIEARLATSLLSALMFIEPQDRRLPQYAERLMMLLDEDINVNQKINMAGHLLYYHALLGKIDLCLNLIVKIGPLVESHDVTAVNKIFWRHMCIYPLLTIGELAEANEFNRDVERLIKEHDLKFMRFIADIYNVGLLLNGGEDEVDRAKAILDRMKSSMNPEQPVDAAWYLFLIFMYAVITKDKESLLVNGTAALDALADCGLKSTANEIRYILALSCYEHGLADEAKGYLAMDSDYGNVGLIASHRCLIIECYAALLAGDNSKAHGLLSKLFSTFGRLPFFGSFFFWYPSSVISRLCTEALRAGIEVDCVRGIIRNRKLLPEDVILEKWPWPVRIYTLGRLRIELEGQEIASSKLQGKPVILLVALIALGGVEVKAERIAELLWPDAEGDAALSAFTTTLSRLRKLIGDEVIVVQGGRVSLDEHQCWLDVRALERHIECGARVGQSDAALADWAETILGLYRGPFLPSLEEDWVRRVRQRLRGQMMRGIACYVDGLRASGNRRAAAPLFERMMAADPDAALTMAP